MTQIYKIFYTYSTFGIFLPQENATQESLHLQVQGVHAEEIEVG